MLRQSTLFSLLLCALVFVACRKDQSETIADTSAGFSKQPNDPGFASNDMVMYWNDKTNTVLGAPMNQPTRSRYFAIVQIAVHDALNSIKPKYETFALTQTHLPFADPDAAVASATYWAIKGLNRQGSFPLDTWYNQSLATIPDGDGKEQGKTLGKMAADAIVALRANDGFTQVLPTSINPPNGTAPGAYRQTNLLNVRFVPNWGTVVLPYATTSNAQFRAAGPNALNTPEYAADYNEVKEKGARVNSTRTAQETQLTLFWAENRPSFLWNNIARAAISTKKMDAWKTARAFALIHTTLADGFNTILESKYHFYYWRPETAIREGNNDGNNATTADATWLPFAYESLNTAVPQATFVSPPIPEYPSGYAMTGGAVSRVLQTVLGRDDVEISISSPNLPGITLQYNSLAQAARDNSITKVYAGWYFRKSVLDGEEMGRQLADYVMAHKFQESTE